MWLCYELPRDPRELPVLRHSLPPRRSSDLFEQADQRTQRAIFVGARRHVGRRRHHEQFADAFVVFGCPVIDEAGLGAAMPGVETQLDADLVLDAQNAGRRLDEALLDELTLRARRAEPCLDMDRKSVG